MLNDLCECISNAQIGRQILDMLRRYTRSYCNDVECPLDGTGSNNQDGSNAQVMIMTLILGLLILGITMQLVQRRRRNIEPQKPSQRDNNGGDNNNNEPRPPPALH